MEVNERFSISDNNSSLPINVEVPSFATSKSCKQHMVMTTAVFLTAGKHFSWEGKRCINRCMLLSKYTTYSSSRYIIFNLEWFLKVNQSKNRVVA